MFSIVVLSKPREKKTVSAASIISLVFRSLLWEIEIKTPP